MSEADLIVCISLLFICLLSLSVVDYVYTTPNNAHIIWLLKLLYYVVIFPVVVEIIKLLTIAYTDNPSLYFILVGTASIAALIWVYIYDEFKTVVGCELELFVNFTTKAVITTFLIGGFSVIAYTIKAVTN